MATMLRSSIGVAAGSTLAVGTLIDRADPRIFMVFALPALLLSPIPAAVLVAAMVVRPPGLTVGTASL